MSHLSSILLVDDDSTANFLSQALIKRAGVADHVLVAENGQEALHVFETSCAPGDARCPNLVLLDVNMPVLNGLEFLAAYKQLPLARQRAVVIVLLTSAYLDRDLAQLRNLPVAGVVEKPLTRQKLQQVLAEHFPPSGGEASEA